MSSSSNIIKVVFGSKTYPGFKILLNYHRITGNTYMACGIGLKISRLRRTFLIIWNLLLLALVLWFCCKEVSHVILPKPKPFGTETRDRSNDTVPPSKNDTQTENNKMFLLLLLNDVRGVSQSSQTLLICLYLMIRGNKLIEIIKDVHQLVEIPVKFERKIGIAITMLHFFYSFVFNLVQTYIMELCHPEIHDHPGHPWYMSGILCFNFFIILNSRLTVMSLILYMNCIVWKPLTDMTNKVSTHTNLKSMYVLASKLNDMMMSMDKIITFYNLVILSLNSIACVSYICSLAIGSDFSHDRISIFPLIESLLQLMILCFICDIIPKAYRELVHKLTKTFAEYSVENSGFNLVYIRMILSHMNEMQNDMSFTVYNIFRVNTNTFFSCLTLILTYSVILIQTN